MTFGMTVTSDYKCAIGCLNVIKRVSDLAAGTYGSGYGCPKIPQEVWGHWHQKWLSDMTPKFTKQAIVVKLQNLEAVFVISYS